MYYIRDCMGKVSYKHRKEISHDVSSIGSEPQKRAPPKASAVADVWREGAPKAASMLEEAIEESLSSLSFPKPQKIMVLRELMKKSKEELRSSRYFPTRLL